jgi:lactoylglutathione lyase
MRLSYAIVFVNDMRRSITFYRDVLGLPVRFESPQWTEFATEGATLALHLAETSHPSSATAQAEAVGHCRPGLRVSNLDEFHRRMMEHHVLCLQEPKDIFGTRVAQYTDPDGLAISVGEERH